MNLANPFNRPDTNGFDVQVQAQNDMLNKNLSLRSDGVDEQIVLDNQRERAELTKWQQDMQEDEKRLYFTLLNYVEDENGFWKPRMVRDARGHFENAAPLCSEDCVWRIISLLRPHISKNTMMSKFRDEDILRNLRRLADTLDIDILLANRRKYFLRFADMQLVKSIVMGYAVSTHYRALGGNEKEYLGKITKDVRMSQDHINEAVKKSLFGIKI